MESAGSVRDEYEVAAALQGAIGLLVRKMRQAHLPGELTLAESTALRAAFTDGELGQLLAVAPLLERLAEKL